MSVFSYGYPLSFSFRSIGHNGFFRPEGNFFIFASAFTAVWVALFLWLFGFLVWFFESGFGFSVDMYFRNYVFCVYYDSICPSPPKVHVNRSVNIYRIRGYWLFQIFYDKCYSCVLLYVQEVISYVYLLCIRFIMCIHLSSVDYDWLLA